MNRWEVDYPSLEPILENLLEHSEVNKSGICRANMTDVIKALESAFEAGIECEVQSSMRSGNRLHY